MDKVSLADKLAQISDQWSPKVVGRLDGYEIKLVKQQNDFVWHKHDGEDEMFLVIEGSIDHRFPRPSRITRTGRIPGGAERR